MVSKDELSQLSHKMPIVFMSISKNYTLRSYQVLDVVINVFKTLILTWERVG